MTDDKSKKVKAAVIGSVVAAAAVATGIALSNKKNRTKVKKIVKDVKVKAKSLPKEAVKIQKKITKVKKTAKGK